MSGRDVLLGVVLVFGILALFAFSFFMPWGYWGAGRTVGYMPMMGYGMMSGMFLIPLLFLVLLGAGVYYAIRGAPSTQERGRALEIIKERYAKGEITKEQYEQLRRDLE